MSLADGSGDALRNTLCEGVAAVRARIALAASRVGRDPSSVSLVAVTKYVEADVIAELVRAGATDVGENRVAPLLEKRAALAALGTAVTWHFIGHLQRNKVRRALPSIDVFHAGDGLRLLRGVDAEVERMGRAPLPVLLQVNVSGESSKGGIAPDDLAAVAAEVAGLANLRATGLMTMAPDAEDPEECRPVFRILRELRDELSRRGYLVGRELSMGMSGDFEAAVEEGATIVRVGRVLYGSALSP